jgi:lysophospholipase L1-like esterase
MVESTKPGLEGCVMMKFLRTHVWLLLILSAGPAAFGQQTKTEPAKIEVKKTEPTKAAALAPSATLPVPRSSEGAWMRLHEQHLEKIKGATPEVLFIGDSITQGFEGGGAYVWRRWYEPRKAVNLGIGGDRTQHVLWRIEHGEIDGVHPKAVVLMIGTNNIGANSPEEIADGVKAITAKLREKLPETKILLLGIFPRDPRPDGYARRAAKAVNEKLSGLADGKFVRYLDIGDKFLEVDGTISREIMPDYLHLSSKGYRIWAEALEPALWETLAEK